jgi:hypothetical protein
VTKNNTSPQTLFTRSRLSQANFLPLGVIHSQKLQLVSNVAQKRGNVRGGRRF